MNRFDLPLLFAGIGVFVIVLAYVGHFVGALYILLFMVLCATITIAIAIVLNYIYAVEEITDNGID